MGLRLPWFEELGIIDRTMKAISCISDPHSLVEAYYSGIGRLIPATEYVSISRRNVDPPYYLITRSSRFAEEFNPWTQRDRLPKLIGGLLGEIAYANQPVIIDDLSARLSKEDPGYFYLQGIEHLVAFPQYDNGEALNITVMLYPPGLEHDPAIIPMLHWQAGLFGRGTTNLVLRNQLSAALQSLDRELKAVGEIQRSLLPEVLPTIPGFELAAHYRTSAQAGGDYYDFFPLPDGSYGIFIADVSGHGTPAAVLMAITHAVAHAQPGTHAPPAALLEHLNTELTRSYTRGGTFITAFYAVLDPKSGTLTYCTAGHNPPRLLRRGQILSLDKGGALPLGIDAEQTYTQTTLTVDPGDLLVLYTDGITEAMPPLKGADTRELYGAPRLDGVLKNCGATSANACIEKICADVAAFTENAPPSDDQTLIAIRCV